METMTAMLDVVHFDFDTLVEELDATAIVTGLASI